MIIAGFPPGIERLGRDATTLLRLMSKKNVVKPPSNIKKRLVWNLHRSPSLTDIMLTIYGLLSLVFLGRFWMKFRTNSMLCNIPATSLHFWPFSQRRDRAKSSRVSSYLQSVLNKSGSADGVFMKFFWGLLLRGLQHSPVLVNIGQRSDTVRDDIHVLCSMPNITCYISFAGKIWFGKTFWRSVKHAPEH